MKSGYWKTTWHYQKGHWETVKYRVSKYTKNGSKYQTVNAAHVYNKTGGVECSYEWKGWNVVYKRAYYSRYILLGSLGIYGFLLNPAAYYVIGPSSGIGGLDSLWIGLNEYAAHLDEVQ